MNIDYTLRTAIRSVLNDCLGRFMSAAEIRTLMHDLNPPQDFTEHQIALSILQFSKSVHNDYETQHDEVRNVNLYRIAI